MEEDIKILQKADPAFQETLVSEVVPDPMEGEQTWPTDEEINEAGNAYIVCFSRGNCLRRSKSLVFVCRRNLRFFILTYVNECYTNQSMEQI